MKRFLKNVPTDDESWHSQNRVYYYYSTCATTYYPERLYQLHNYTVLHLATVFVTTQF